MNNSRNHLSFISLKITSCISFHFFLKRRRSLKSTFIDTQKNVGERTQHIYKFYICIRLIALGESFLLRVVCYILRWPHKSNHKRRKKARVEHIYNYDFLLRFVAASTIYCLCLNSFMLKVNPCNIKCANNILMQ